MFQQAVHACNTYQGPVALQGGLTSGAKLELQTAAASSSQPFVPIGTGAGTFEIGGVVLPTSAKMTVLICSSTQFMKYPGYPAMWLL